MSEKPNAAHVQYRVPYADTDRMGVVYYANYLVYFERVRNAFLRNAGLPYAELESRGVLLPVIRVEADYKRAAGFDELLDLYGWVDARTHTRVSFTCEVRRNEELLTSGRTIHAVIARESGKPVKVPAEMTAYCDKVTSL